MLDKSTPLIIPANALAESLQEFVSWRDIAVRKSYNKGLLVGIVGTILVAKAINHYEKKSWRQ